jgi:hypothetical protein
VIALLLVPAVVVLLAALAFGRKDVLHSWSGDEDSRRIEEMRKPGGGWRS